VQHRDDNELQLEHLLHFDMGTPKKPGTRQGSFALLYPAEDADVAAAVAERLRRLGKEVIDPAASDSPFALLLGRVRSSSRSR
jgi:hypothetical protein